MTLKMKMSNVDDVIERLAEVNNRQEVVNIIQACIEPNASGTQRREFFHSNKWRKLLDSVDSERLILMLQIVLPIAEKRRDEAVLNVRQECDIDVVSDVHSPT